MGEAFPVEIATNFFACAGKWYFIVAGLSHRPDIVPYFEYARMEGVGRYHVLALMRFVDDLDAGGGSLGRAKAGEGDTHVPKRCRSPRFEFFSLYPLTLQL